jgi:glycosyltransferase involved in cell wall biosynthesis
MAKVSIIIPSRNERFLAPTVADLCAKARGDIEIIPVCEGYWPGDPANWPNPRLIDDPRVIILHHGQALGMRPAINHAARIARGEYLMKLDGHCMVAEGFDEALKADCADDWVVVPRRFPLDPETWTIKPDPKYPVDAHYLSFPYQRPDDCECGLHGTVWRERTQARQDVLIDDEMSSQGSCWFMSRKMWPRIGPLDIEHYGTFIQEFQEVGMKAWLGGGAVKVNKKTWYAHLHKGQKYGRGYSWSSNEHKRGHDYTTDHWMHDRWPERTRDLAWLVEKFWPVPTWPDNWAEIAKAHA